MNLDEKTLKDLTILAAKARMLILEGVHAAKAGHPGGSLSCVDALTALYFHEMQNLDPENGRNPERDRFVLSKGHCAPALYAVLVLRGFLPRETIPMLRSIKGYVSGHPDMNHTNGVDMSTGSLGQGISAAVGMALGARLGGKSYRTYAICGDGEIEEGQVWEAAMAAAKWNLDNLCVLVDVNGLQIDGPTEKVMPSEPLDKKFEAFNWHVISVPDGNDIAQIIDALDKAKTLKGKPTVILLHTVKGKGVSYMEYAVEWHGKAPGDELYAVAMEELAAHLAELEA